MKSWTLGAFCLLFPRGSQSRGVFGRCNAQLAGMTPFYVFRTNSVLQLDGHQSLTSRMPPVGSIHLFKQHLLSTKLRMKRLLRIEFLSFLSVGIVE